METFLIVLLVAAVVAAAACVVGLYAASSKTTRTEEWRGCFNCRHSDVVGCEEPCSDCVEHFPNLPKWEASHV